MKEKDEVILVFFVYVTLQKELFHVPYGPPLSIRRSLIPLDPSLSVQISLSASLDPNMLLTILLLLLVLYGVTLAFLWGWAIVHAYTTPRIPFSRRGLWTVALCCNPLASMWYWYIWKRWAFWILFAPTFIFAALLPELLEAVIHALSIREIGDRFVSIANVFLTNILDAIPLPVAIPLFAFPFILRLAALAHLGGNNDLEAADRNDHAVTFALPLFGFGAAMTYCLKWRRGWAVIGFCWFLLAVGVTWSLLRFIA